MQRLCFDQCRWKCAPCHLSKMIEQLAVRAASTVKAKLAKAFVKFHSCKLPCLLVNCDEIHFCEFWLFILFNIKKQFYSKFQMIQ